MTYQSKDLSVLAYANGFTLWHYTTMDTAADVNGAGYFNPASDMVRVGDMIMANVDTDGTPASGIFLVNANAGGAVDVADMIAGKRDGQQARGVTIPRYPWSTASLGRLQTCDERIQRVFNAVADYIDVKIICGHRPEAEQNNAFDLGKSQVKWPHGAHNTVPSKAIDAAPCPIDWKDRERATHFAGFVLGVAASMGLKLRWGGDWDGDWQVKDNDFDDLWHFEIEEMNP